MALPYLSDSEVDVTLFVPCYNEEENIIPTLQKIEEACAQVQCSYEIIVIDDNSSDTSLEKLLDHQKNNPHLPLSIYHNKLNQGLANNYWESALLGKGRNIRIVCGDDVETVETQVAILSLMDQADTVVPFHDKVANKGWFRTLLSRTYTRLVNLASGQKVPYWNGCGLFRRYHVLRWGAQTRGFGFQALLLYQVLANGGTFVSVKCTYAERKTGKAKALTRNNLRSVIHSILSIALRRIDRIFFKAKTPVLPTLMTPAAKETIETCFVRKAG